MCACTYACIGMHDMMLWVCNYVHTYVRILYITHWFLDCMYLSTYTYVLHVEKIVLSKNICEFCKWVFFRELSIEQPVLMAWYLYNSKMVNVMNS